MFLSRHRRKYPRHLWNGLGRPVPRCHPRIEHGHRYQSKYCGRHGNPSGNCLHHPYLSLPSRHYPRSDTTLIRLKIICSTSLSTTTPTAPTTLYHKKLNGTIPRLPSTPSTTT